MTVLKLMVDRSISKYRTMLRRIRISTLLRQFAVAPRPRLREPRLLEDLTSFLHSENSDPRFSLQSRYERNSGNDPGVDVSSLTLRMRLPYRALK